MLSIARNIWKTCAKNNFQLKAVHIQDVDNRIRDILSRWQSLPSAFKQLQMLLRNSSYEFVTLSDDTFDMILPYNFRICMESIKDKNEDRPESSFQPGTLQILKCQLRTYLLFCVNFDTTSFPVDSETINKYACFLLEEFKSSDSIRNYISGIKAWATFSNTMLTTFIHLQ